ncbi:MAG: glutamate--tRNA ligase family protein, partial [Candidatus Odinarchaeia archaeon]
IDDHLLGITHILRGKDLIKEDKVEMIIWDRLNWPHKEFIHYGRIKFKGLSLSKSKSAMNIRKGVYSGWTDPRTWSLQSLMIRGFKPEALREAILDLGLSIADIEYSPATLYSINRRMIDPEANRLFYVEEPKKLEISNLSGNKIVSTPPWHLDFPERGVRDITVKVNNGSATVLVSSSDFRDFKVNTLIRLKDLFNIKVTNVLQNSAEAVFISKTIEEARADGIKKIIQWVPVDENIDVEIIMPDGTYSRGVSELNILKINEKTVIQFERFGFVRIFKIDKNRRKVIAYYTHP